MKVFSLNNINKSILLLLGFFTILSMDFSNTDSNITGAYFYAMGFFTLLIYQEIQNILRKEGERG